MYEDFSAWPRHMHVYHMNMMEGFDFESKIPIASRHTVIMTTL